MISIGEWMSDDVYTALHVMIFHTLHILPHRRIHRGDGED